MEADNGELCSNGDFNDWVTLKESSSLKETNKKIITIILEVLSNEILYRLGNYKNAHDLWTQLRLEEKLRDKQSTILDI